MKKRFALVGAAGYIAPRHMEAISKNGYELVAAFDPFDSVGVIDRYAPNAAFFTEFERFDRHLELLKREGIGVDYVSICSPNYLHDAHARFGLRLGADVICEKPLVLHARNASGLISVEEETGKSLFCILQARLHNEATRLKSFVNSSTGTRHKVNINYITPRGTWYDYSWKGAEFKSGGVATNIGIHLFDLVLSNFGYVDSITITKKEPRSCSGKINMQHADVEFSLSVNTELQEDGTIDKRRIFNVDGEKFNLSSGFEDLHIQSYKEIVEGRGFRINDALPAITLAEAIRGSEINQTIFLRQFNNEA